MLRRVLLTILLLSVCAVSVSAQWQYVGYAQITVGATAVGFPASVLTSTGHAYPTQAYCTVETGEIRWTVDGTTPTSTVGTIAAEGSALPLINGSDLLTNFRAIRRTSTSASLSCSFFTGGNTTQTPLLPSGSGGAGGGGATTDVNIAEIGGTATSAGIISVTGTGTAGAPVSSVLTVQGITSGTAIPAAGIFTHNTDTSAGIAARNMPVIGFVANAAAPTPTETFVGYGSMDLAANIRTRTADPCSLAKTHIAINIVTATTTELTAALSGASNFYYICSIDLVTAGANNVALVDDDTDGCGSVTSGLAGGITAATGWNFAANGGLTKGNGAGTVFKTGGLNRVVCLMTSAAVQLSGSIGVVAAP